MNSTEKSYWSSAMYQEMSDMKKKNVLQLVAKPVHCKSIRNKRGFMNKKYSKENVTRFRPRLVRQGLKRVTFSVVKGFSQRHGLDYNDVFSPVVQYTS